MFQITSKFNFKTVLDKNQFRNYFLLHLIVFIWGFTAILGKLITLPADSLVWYRLIIAIGAIFFYLLLKNISLKINIRNMLQFFGVGVIIALHWIFFYHSIKVSNVSVAVVCLSSATFFTAFLEPLLNRRKVLLYEMLFGLAVILGLYFIFQIETAHKQGIYYGLVSAFFSALFTVINSRLTKKHSSELLSFYEMIGGFLIITIYFLLSSRFEIALFAVSVSDWVYLFVLGTICTAFAFIISVKVMKEISAFTVVLSINLEPVYSVILAYFLFAEEEQMQPGFYIGTLFILSTIFLNGYLKGRKNKK